MNQENAHPVALRPGKVLVEAETFQKQLDSAGNIACLCFSKTHSGSIKNCIAVDPATVHPGSVLEELRAKLADSIAAANRNADWAMNTEQERDTARAELAEALEWMREEIYPYRAISYGHTGKGNAILTRHDFEEKRKGERRKLPELNYVLDGWHPRGSDRRKASVAMDWQARARGAEALADSLRVDLATTEAECERLRRAIESWKAEEKMWKEFESAATARAEQAEAKLAAIKTAIEDGQSTGYCLYLICGPEPILGASPAQQQYEYEMQRHYESEMDQEDQEESK